jgi:hypothetical protein
MNDWTERYNIHSLDLDKKHSLTVRVSWASRIVDWVTPLNDNGAFTVHFMARTLNEDFDASFRSLLCRPKRVAILISPDKSTPACKRSLTHQSLSEVTAVAILRGYEG